MQVGADSATSFDPGQPALGDARVLELFHPLIQTWFAERFGRPTAPQADGWPRIAAGEDVLIAAPTGSGKTLAAFLACIDHVLRDALASPVPLPDRVHILYVSPLKALSNDVQRNLEAPLAEIAAVALREGVRLPEIRVAVRTGDTPPAERDKQAKRPPHILVTTPESLYILLTTGRGRAALQHVRTVIVDEIHAIAPSKRGAHLAISLERLEHLVRQHGGAAPVRVGLSATQRPIERVARLLVGTDRPLPHIVDSGHRRTIDLAIELPDDELGAVASLEQLGRVYDSIAAQVEAHRSTLVFVNTRRMVERVAAALEQRLGEDAVVAHHGSMSRERRLAAEQRLKHGLVKCAVATASLELGIDVGTVDLVVQLGSPRSIATLLQRIGRSGHHLGGTPKGRLYALTRDQLIECAALVRGIRRGNLDTLEVRDAPLDVLSQQIVAMCAAEEWDEAALGALIRQASPYAALEPARLEQILTMLDEGVSERRNRLGAYLHRDRVAGKLRARRGAKLAAVTCGGAIPDTANYAVVQWPEEVRVGEVDEDFAIDSSAGDIFQLGNTAWRIHRIENGRVLVQDAHGAPPTIPFWFGEAPARTAELSDEVSDLRREVDARLVAGEAPDAIAAWLAAEACVPARGAAQTVAYLAAGRAALGGVPRKDLLIAERFFDEGGGMQLVIHAPLGGRVNRAWGLALRKKFCRSFDFELQAAATDDGIVISLGQPHSFALESVFAFLASAQAKEVLIQALLDAPMFEVRWRWNTTRALAVLRRSGGKKVPPHLVRMRAADMLSVVFPQAQACQENIVGEREVPDHPLVFETVRDCLVEVMDVDGLTALMQRLERGEVQILARDTVEPSVLSHELLSANPYAFLDDAPLEERRTRAITLRRGLGAEVQAMAEVSTALDADAITAAEAEVTPVVRSADELHDALLALWLAPAAQARALAPEASRWMDGLAASGRAVRLVHATGEAWCAIERLGAARLAFDRGPGPTTYAVVPPLEVPSFAPAPAEPEQALRRIVAGQLDHRGPITAPALAAELGLSTAQVLGALLELEADGAILRGQFAGEPVAPQPVRAALAAADTDAAMAALQWCNRRILARIHRLTLVRLRREIEPVSAAALMRFLLAWQRVGPGAQLARADGLARVIAQLQGFQCAAGAWEREVLPARLHGYDGAWLDQLCLAGEAAWCRLTPRTLAAPDDDEPVAARGRLAPSRATPLGVVRRADVGWLRAGAASGDAADSSAPMSAAAQRVVDVLAARGASFLAELIDGAALAPDEVEDALWELVAAGRATADGFASLRVLVDKRRGESRSHFDAAPPAAPAAAPPRKWLDAVKRARGRDQQRPHLAPRALPTAGGRWALLPAVAPTGSAGGTSDDVAEAWARQLLARYGVVFRDLLARETALPPWRDLLVALRRLEARGEIRGGRFVSGFVGEQFALPEAVDGLRAARSAAGAGVVVRVAATDPLNLAGILSPGARVPAVLGNAVLIVDGVVVASREAGRVVPRPELPAGAAVDDDLAYTPPPRPLVAPGPAPASQTALAW